MDIADQGEVHDRDGWPDLMVLVAGHEPHGCCDRRGAIDVHDCLRLHYTHLRVDLREHGASLRPQDVQPPSLAADVVGAAHGLVPRPLLIQEGQILCQLNLPSSTNIKYNKKTFYLPW